MANGPVTGAEPDGRGLEDLSDEDLVDMFLSSSKSDRDAAHLCFEIIVSRYHWLINHVVRNSRYKFPAWDAAEDVIARVIFKVYRGLGQWRRQGKLASFIARIATSEMIDTIRRVGRDKSWNPSRTLAETDADEVSIVDRAASNDPSPEASVMSRELSDILDRLLAEVCQDWKDSIIVNEYIIGNRGAKEISEKYDMTEDLVYQRARRLRVRLVKGLAKRGITSADQLFGSRPRTAED